MCFINIHYQHVSYLTYITGKNKGLKLSNISRTSLSDLHVQVLTTFNDQNLIVN